MGPRSLTPITEQEYESIEAAVMETARGRWFLAEFARRNRTADTLVLLDAIGRLESAVAGDRSTAGVERIRVDLAEMAGAIARTRVQIAAIGAPDGDTGRLAEASQSLDAIVRTTEQATSTILEAAEHVQEVAWTLREAGESHAACDELDRRATEIYTACSFQDLTAQRTTRIVETLRFLEDRVGAMTAIWGDTAPPVPPALPRPPEADLSQSDVDLVIGVEARPAELRRRGPVAPVAIENDIVFLSDPEPPGPAAPAVAPAPRGPTGGLRTRLPLAQAFRDIDALSVQDRLLRFT